MKQLINKYDIYFEKFLYNVSNTALTKENIKKAFFELKNFVGLSDSALFESVLNFLEKLIEKEDSLDINKGTSLISLKIKIFKRNLVTEKHKLIYGYLTSIAAETLGNFFVNSNKPMDYIGIELEKGNIIVKNGGNFVGMRMSGGSIHILGNTGMCAGQRMSGGIIKIDGIAGAFLGYEIVGGKIEAKIADSTASRSKNVVVGKYIDQKTHLIGKDIKKYATICKDEIKRYAEDISKIIGEWEKRKSAIKIPNGIIVKEISKEISKNNEIYKKFLLEQQNDKISELVREVYGEVDIKRIEEVDYIEKNEDNVKVFVIEQNEKEEKNKDEIFENLIRLFKYKNPNKEEILNANLSIDDIKKILNNVTPLTFMEKIIIGYLTSIAAEKLAIRGEALFIEKNFDYIGIEMKDGKIVAKNAGEYLGKNMYGGEIRVEGNALGNVGEGMIDGKIEIKGHVYGDYVGWRMKGGEILIRGGCRNFVGLKMLGGKITIEKSAGTRIGEKMEGGEILIKGRCGVVGKGMKNGIIRIKEGIISDEREGGEIYTLQI